MLPEECTLVSKHVTDTSIILIYTYLLHGAESFLRSQLVLQLIKKFPSFYGTIKFITVLTSARNIYIYIYMYIYISNSLHLVSEIN